MPKLSIDNYISLLRAGYSAEELNAYNAGGEIPAEPAAPKIVNPEPAAPKIVNPEPAAPKIVNMEPAAQAEPVNSNNESQALVNEMRQLVALMRNVNIRDVTIPTETPPDAAQIAATILAPARANKEDTYHG